MQVGHSQTLPQLGKDPIEKIVAAMTAEEKVSLLVGSRNARVRRPISRSRQHAKYSAGRRRNDLPDRRLGIPAIVVADGPAGLRISPTREGNGGDPIIARHSRSLPC